MIDVPANDVPPLMSTAVAVSTPAEEATIAVAPCDEPSENKYDDGSDATTTLVNTDRRIEDPATSASVAVEPDEAVTVPLPRRSTLATSTSLVVGTRGA